MPLYEQSPPAAHLQDIAEAKSSEEGTTATVLAAETLAPPSATPQAAVRDDAVRSAGVGSDSENEPQAGASHVSCWYAASHVMFYAGTLPRTSCFMLVRMLIRQVSFVENFSDNTHAPVYFYS